MQASADRGTAGVAARWLNGVEKAGNALPHPMALFVGGALLVMVFSEIAMRAKWSVEKTVTKEVAAEGGTLLRQETVNIEAIGLLSGDGLYWAIDSLVENFTGFAPLGIVLVGMLGIGLAERAGAIGALLKVFMYVTPARLLTPAMLLIGIFSSIALDAGYVVLPPLAAALYRSVGRSPLAGLAAVFAGVSAGFSANLLITGLDPLLAGFTEEAAQILEPEYRVAATCNWWFMIGSAVVLTLVGWAVTAWFVEPRYANLGEDEGGPGQGGLSTGHEHILDNDERIGLLAGIVVLALVLALIIAMTVIPGGPLHGLDHNDRFDRWVGAIVPILFLTFVLPGLAYGIASGAIRRDKDVAKLMTATMADMAPYIVLAFFAAQFVAYFRHSNLGQMIAMTGGAALASTDLPLWLLLAVFILTIMAANIFIGSASAKYAFIAPVFVPMFMRGAAMSPELTQAAYRVGDSVTNIITPLNPYVIIILVFMQKYVPKAGIGTLVALMLPYTIVFAVVWTVLLVIWVGAGLELGPGGPLTFTGQLTCPQE